MRVAAWLPPRRAELVAVALVTAVAALLRFPGLSRVPPGLWVDEAVQALQGEAFGAGRSLPDLAQIKFPEWPVWCAIEAASVRIFGLSILAARYPAALAGTLTVPLAWWTGRMLLGPVGGIGAAAFLACSFWHVQASRVGIAPVMTPAEGLLVALLLFAGVRRAMEGGPSTRKASLRAVAAGAVAGLGCWGYAAGWSLPAWGVVAAAAAAGGPRRRTVAAFAAGVGLLVVPLLADGGRRTEHVRTVGIAPPAAVARAAALVAGNLVAAVEPDRESSWQNHPAGAARLSWIERVAVLAGCAAAATGVPGMPVPGWLLPVWAALALLPEALAGRMHLLRGIAMLAPLSLLAGAGAAAAAHVLVRSRGRVVRRAWAAAALGVVAANAALTADHLYRRFARDPRVASWYFAPAVESSRFLAAAAAAGRRPLEVLPPLEYANAPIHRFLLAREIESGRIIPGVRRPGRDRVLHVARDPWSHEPVLFLLGSPRFPRDRAVELVTLGELLAAEAPPDSAAPQAPADAGPP